MDKAMKRKFTIMLQNMCEKILYKSLTNKIDLSQLLSHFLESKLNNLGATIPLICCRPKQKNSYQNYNIKIHFKNWIINKKYLKNINFLQSCTNNSSYTSYFPYCN